jgi:hypothetical protein
MREWNLTDQHPYHLVIAADGQLTSLDYADDQIWELKLGGGDPPALALETTFGLRARSMRLFPRFQSGDYTFSDPLTFFQPPQVTRLYPNFIVVRFFPIAGVEICYEIWAAASQTLAGRFTFHNLNDEPVDFGFEWTGELNPLGREGRGLAVTQIGVNNVLSGASEDLEPVCFMTGGPAPGSGPQAGLVLRIELQPSAVRQITWALAALEEAQASYDLARLTTAREWEAEKARIELHQVSRQVEIHTGDPDWDAALAASQRAAAGLVFAPGGDLPNPSFVLARTPEQGYSLRGDGSDYTHLWNGQSVLDAWYLASILLPGMEQYAAGWIENFLAVQQTDGFIDWKPGIAGQRSKRLAQPILATLAWRIYELLEDVDWLRKIYPGLMNFIHVWFGPQHDGDQDGYPEWDHPYQIGLDALPLYHPWQPGSQGVDPRMVESPALAAFLYRECQSLAQMAALLGKEEDRLWLDAVSGSLKTLLDSQWSPAARIYPYRDAETHQNPPGMEWVTIEGSGRKAVGRAIAPAQRLLVRIIRSDEKTRQTHILIQGQTAQGEQAEEVSPRQIRWLYGEGRYSTRNPFSRVDEVVVLHAQPSDICRIESVDYSLHDISLLLPLWAGIPDAERARQMIEATILSRFLRPFGLPVCPPQPGCEFDESTRLVSLPWNQLVAEGLLAYGYRQEAVALVERLMQSVILNLKTSHQFSAFYHSESGKGSGDRGALSGMAPVGLFLQTLGLKLLTPKKMIVEGFNPYPWPVNVQYRGMKLNFESARTSIELADGCILTIDDPWRHIITLP